MAAETHTYSLRLSHVAEQCSWHHWETESWPDPRLSPWWRAQGEDLTSVHCGDWVAETQKRCHTASLFCCQSQRPAKCACLHVNSLKPQIQLLDLTTHISAVSCHRVWWVATTLDKNKTLWSLPPVLRGSVAKVVEALWGHQALSFQISSSYHFT